MKLPLTLHHQLVIKTHGAEYETQLTEARRDIDFPDWEKHSTTIALSVRSYLETQSI